MILKNDTKQKNNKLNKNYLWIIFCILFFGISIGISIYPVRIILLSNWWINAALYGLLSIVCLLIMIYVFLRQNKNRKFMIMLLISTLLMGWQGLVSLSEVSNCWIEDSRYTQLIACKSGGAYQQIETLPIGVQGYCTYCPWY